MIITMGGPGWHLDGTAGECKEKIDEYVRNGVLTAADRDQLRSVIDRMESDWNTKMGGADA